MQASHATVGLSTTMATVYMTGLLTGWHGHDAAWAGNAAGMVVLVAGGLYATAQWFMQWRYPTAPALPGQMVEIPPDAPPVAVAQVQPPQPPAPPVAVIAAHVAAPVPAFAPPPQNPPPPV